MGFVISGLGWVFVIANFVFFVLIVVQMFKRQQTGLGIATIVTAFCGIGGLIALVYGWMKATEWNIKNIMIGYTATWVLAIAFLGCGGAMTASSVSGDLGKQIELEMKKQQKK